MTTKAEQQETWEPFEIALPVYPSDAELWQMIVAHPDQSRSMVGLSGDTLPTLEQFRAAIVAYLGESTIYRNNLFQVAKYDCDEQPVGWPCRVIHLSIKRLDREPVRDWRHLQRIKNEIVGPEHEAVELYPAESRLVDSANQYHLWVMADPELRLPFGFGERMVDGADGVGGSKQRPFEA